MTHRDDDLSAYLDDALPAAAMAALADAIAADPALRQRLDLMRAADRLAAVRMAAVLDEPVPQDLMQAVMQAGSTPAERAPRGLAGRLRALWPGVGFGALAGVAATVAVVALWTPPPPTWAEQVAADQRVYAQETVQLVEVGADRAEFIRDWLGNRVGRDFDIPDLAPFGLAFRGARLLVAEGKPVAQLVYTDAAGTVVALYLTARPDAPDLTAAPLRLGDLDAVIWREGGTAMLLIGPAGAIPLGPLAAAVAQVI